VKEKNSVKKISSIFILLFSFVCILFAQKNEVNSAGFLFDDFKEAVIYFDDGSRTQEQINPNILDNTLHYIDRAENNIKVASSKNNITLIRMSDGSERSFVFDKQNLKEVVSDSPVIWIKYNAKVRVESAKGPYGTGTGTSVPANYTYGSSTSESHQGNAGMSGLKGLDRVISGIQIVYWIEKDGNKKKFANVKDFLKIYSKHKDILKKSIEEKEIQFDDIKAVVQLCQYAESL
jgi:hypothetical protein